VSSMMAQLPLPALSALSLGSGNLDPADAGRNN